MALILPSAEPSLREPKTLLLFRRAEDKRRRLNFDFFDQLDCLDLSDVPRYVSESLEGAD